MEAKLYHIQLQSSESAKHGELYELKLSLLILLKPVICSSKTPNSQ